jgi:F-type H+-transporting ATPase subunit a
LSGKQIGIGFIVLVVVGVILRVIYPTSDPVVSVSAEPFFSLGGAEFTNAMFSTLVLDAILIGVAFLVSGNMQMVPRGLQNVTEAILEALYNLFKGVDAKHTPSTFPLAATIFIFVILSNLSGLFPGVGSIGFCHVVEGEEASGVARMALVAPETSAAAPAALAAEEGAIKYIGCPAYAQHIIPLWRPPSTDLNFTIGITLIAWFWIQYLAFKALGVGYLGKYFVSPFGKLSEGKGPIMTVVGLLELISLFARIPAFAFRLFGNIFAGEVLIIVLLFLLPLGLPTPIYLFEVFVAFIQAFIFAILVMAFISIDTTGHDEEAHGEAH